MAAAARTARFKQPWPSSGARAFLSVLEIYLTSRVQILGMQFVSSFVRNKSSGEEFVSRALEFSVACRLPRRPRHVQNAALRCLHGVAIKTVVVTIVYDAVAGIFHLSPLGRCMRKGDCGRNGAAGGEGGGRQFCVRSRTVFLRRSAPPPQRTARPLRSLTHCDHDQSNAQSKERQSRQTDAVCFRKDG